MASTRKNNVEASKPDLDHPFLNELVVCVASIIIQILRTLMVTQTMPVPVKEYCEQLVNFLLVDKLVKTIARPELPTRAEILRIRNVENRLLRKIIIKTQNQKKNKNKKHVLINYIFLFPDSLHVFGTLVPNVATKPKLPSQGWLAAKLHRNQKGQKILEPRTPIMFVWLRYNKL